MARVAGTLAAFERRVHKGLHQLGAPRLVRIVALHTIGSSKRLFVVGLLQTGVLRVVTIEAKLRRRFRQVIGELDLVGVAGFMYGMARAAARVQRRVPASLIRHIQSDRMAAQAKVFFFTASATAVHWRIDAGRGT